MARKFYEELMLKPLWDIKSLMSLKRFVIIEFSGAVTEKRQNRHLKLITKNYVITIFQKCYERRNMKDQIHYNDAFNTSRLSFRRIFSAQMSMVR